MHQVAAILDRESSANQISLTTEILDLLMQDAS